MKTVSTSTSDTSKEPATLTITSTFTAEPLQEPLQFWIDHLGLRADIQFGPWGQVFQQLLNPSSEIGRNAGGVNILLVRIEDWRPDIEQTANDFIRAVTQAAHRVASPLIICLCPASRATLAGHLGRSIRQTEQLVVRELVGLPSVYFVTGEQLQALYTVEEYDDAPSDRLASIPYTPLFFSALGTMIARRISALTVPRYKVIVLDCDHTLWDGVCAEDGPNGVRIDAEYEAVQKFMIHQHNAGMLLGLCSKNNEADVAAVFESHPKMLLKRDHFVSWRGQLAP